jgi:hypothetical protein
MTLSEVDAELSAVNAAILKAIAGKSGSFNSGQGSFSVSRQELAALQRHREELQAMRDDLAGEGSRIYSLGSE